MAGALKNKDANVKLFRIHKIDEEIRSGTYPNKGTLSKKLEVSERTIARDLECLRDFYNAPLEFDSLHNGFYYTEKDFFIKYVPLSEGELFSISLFDQLLSQYKNTPLENQLRSIFRKITSALPEEVQVDSTFLASEVTYVSNPLAKIDTNVFEQVIHSLKTRSILEINYQALTEERETARKIAPYNLVCKGGSWYVVAFCYLKNDVRTFSLSRISDPTLTSERFSVPPNFEIKNYIDPSFGVWTSEKELREIRIVCKGFLRQIVMEKKWHDSQTTRILPSGDVEVAFKTTQLTEVLQTVMSFGENAIVLEPPELVEMVKKSAQAILENYSHGGGKAS